MIRILFVCHGNICRSPMAEFVMKDLVERHGETHLFSIASAATHTDEIGNAVHPGTERILAEHGIGCAGKTARRITKDDYEAWDLLIGMDSANMSKMIRLFGGDPVGKIHSLLEYAGSDADIADPWYSGDFETTYEDVLAGCTGIYHFLRQQSRQS